MVDVVEIKNFLFIPDRELLVISLSNCTNQTIPVHGGYDREMLAIISDMNRKQMIKVFENNPETDGCLPLKCIGVDDDSTNISPRYLTHCFINIIELVFGTEDNAQLFVKNAATLALPTSNHNLELIMTTLLKTASDVGEDKNNDNDDVIHFKLFIQILLDKLLTMQRGMTSTISKNASKLNKKSAYIGGISNIKDITGNDGDVLSKGLQECAGVIHESMRRNAESIKAAVLNQNDHQMMAVKRFVEICSGRQPLYSNLDISFELMYGCIGEIFNALFFHIIPRTSMMEAMQGSFYNAAVLHELKLQDKFPDIVCTPILYRLINSCFKDPGSREDMEEIYHRYISDNYSGVIALIDKLGRENCSAPEILCSIALKSNIQDEKFNEALYWLLNRKRSCTFEYYIILMAVLYVNARCPTLAAHNKRGNTKSFIDPIYAVMRLFHQHVQGVGIEVSLCSDVMETFSTLYQVELKEALEEFAKSVL